MLLEKKQFLFINLSILPGIPDKFNPSQIPGNK